MTLTLFLRRESKVDQFAFSTFLTSTQRLFKMTFMSLIFNLLEAADTSWIGDGKPVMMTCQ